MSLVRRVVDFVTKALTLSPLTPRLSAGRGWYPIIHEPYTGAWQANQDIRPDTVLSYFAVYACTTLIASDIGKLRLRLVSQDANGIWTETTNPAWSPVLRKPNRYQTIHKFIEQWMVSKLVHGNAYVLKERDARGVVRALYVLDPTRVLPLVATDGSVYYQLLRDDLAGVAIDATQTVPASEMIHDPMVALFHPLIGVSPIFACGVAATEGLRIQDTSSKFFGNGSRPSGILTAPGAISDADVARLKEYWQTNFTGDNVGKVAVVGDGLTYKETMFNAVDMQLIEQLKWTAENICTCYHVPPSMVGIGPYPPYANSEPLLQQYYAQCLQSLMVACETCLDEGLELPSPYGTEFDIDELIWMDTATKSKAASDGIGSGALSPDEARKKYFGIGPVDGGDTPYMQQQMYSLAALAERDADKPFSKPRPAVPAASPDDVDDDDDQMDPDDIATRAAALLRKEWTA